MKIQTFHFRHHAMATLFEGWLVGEDQPHLRSVGNLLQIEIDRIEQLLSRHDPAAELARINREAPDKLVKTEKELTNILLDCLHWYETSGGHFNIGVNSLKDKTKEPPLLSQVLKIYPESSEVRFKDPDLSLDLGGYGKGYALDRLADILENFQVHNFLLHGGKSSILTRGKKANGLNWQVGVGEELAEVVGGFSYSGGEERTSAPFDCAVWAPNALIAEVYSTALIAMGRIRAESFVVNLPVDTRVQFIQPLAV